MPPRKKPTKRPGGGPKARAPRTRKKAPEETVLPLPEAVVETLPEAVFPPDLTTIHVEPIFADRVAPPPVDRPFPSARRAIFFDVENTSRATHIARVIEHLAVDRAGRRTDFVAVGNWRVIGHDTARLLARHGAHLVHSAPSVGVRDWSDLRIAVAAGVWLASARPGDMIEIVSDDRAFDAVGDVSVSLGIAFRRLSYRALTGDGARAAEPAEEREPAQAAAGARHHSRRRGRGGWRDRPAAPRAEVAASSPPARSQVARPPVAPADEPHTAPHDELVTIVQDLIAKASGRVVTIDTVANTLKSRGFSRPPGSPRLITRLRRIKELTVSRSGAITLTDGDGPPDVDSGEPASHPADPRERPAERAEWPAESGEDLSVGPGNEMPADGSAPAAPPGSTGSGPRRGRRSRRGGRRHRRRGTGAPA